MLKLIAKSSNKKLGGCAATYRAGTESVYGTCPSTCPLKPETQKGAERLSVSYLSSLALAVPPGGVAWTYTHFEEAAEFGAKLKPRPENNVHYTCINNSTDTIDTAVASFQKGLPTVVVLPESDSGEELKQFRVESSIPERTSSSIRMVRCPAEYSDRTCNDCGGDLPLCARQDRDYVIKFTAHGTKKKVIKLRHEGSGGSGGCYGDTGPTRLQWEKTRAQARATEHIFESPNLADGDVLLTWVQTLPVGTKLRHHVVGDVGEI